jgi:hypothetical protein
MKTVWLICVLVSAQICLGYAPYSGFVQTTWTPAVSDIYLSNDDAGAGNTPDASLIAGSSPFYKADITVSSSPIRDIGDIPYRPVGGSRLTLAGNKGLTGVSADKYYEYYDNNNVIHYERITPTPVMLGGYFLVILYPLANGKCTMPFVSTSEGNNNLYYRVDDDSVSNLQAAIVNQTTYSVGGFSCVPASSIMVQNGGISQNQYCGMKADEYLTAYASTLKSIGVRYESMLFVQGTSNVASNVPGTGNYLPAILVSYGKKQTSYAMYGVWHDQAKAKEFGYDTGQKVYFSEKSVLPDNQSNSTYPDVALLSLAGTMRYGRQCFSESQVLQNKKAIFPLLAWRSGPVWSEMNKGYDPVTQIVKPDSATGEIPPTCPDDPNNTNGPGMNTCPDRDFYWDYFCQCVETNFKQTTQTTDSKKFQDMKDYLYVQQMQSQYDPSVYGMDNSLSTQTITTGTQPTDPAIFNKECQLLNKMTLTTADPFSDSADFYLDKLSWYSEDLARSSKDWNKFTSAFSGFNPYQWSLDLSKFNKWYVSDPATHVVRPVLEKMRQYFETTLKNSPKAILALDNTAIQYVNADLKDSAWYIGSPVRNYQPYNDGKEFVVFDENCLSSGGVPFHLVCYDADKTFIHGWPSYVVGGLTVGIPIPVDYLSQTSNKLWYIEWKWRMVYVNKFGQKYTVGFLTHQEFMMQESGQYMAAGQGYFGKSYNTHFIIQNGAALADSSAAYDSSSKDYRTDQTDPSDRSSDIDKGEAVWQIAQKILVAELFDLAMKLVHYISERNDQAGTAAKVTYEATKRLENYLVVRKTCEMAKDVYEGYVYWRETMDLIRECRDTYNSISAAWDGLSASALNLYNYYKKLDYRSIRLTNITKLLPITYIYEIDITSYCLQSSLVSFNKSVDALCFQSDKLTRGNYGPFNPIILAVYAELLQATGQSGEQTSNIIDSATSALNKVTQGTKDCPANKAYLSNITKATYNVLTNQRLIVMNERNRAAAGMLFLIQTEANDWVTYNNHMRYAWGNVGSSVNAATHNNFYPIINGFSTPPGLFADQGFFNSIGSSGGSN